MVQRRRQLGISRGADYEKRRSNPPRSRIKDELQPRPFGGQPPLTPTADGISPQSLEQPPQDVIEGLTRKRPLPLVEAARPLEQPGLVWPRDFKIPAFDRAWKLQEASSRRPRIKNR